MCVCCSRCSQCALRETSEEIRGDKQSPLFPFCRSFCLFYSLSVSPSPGVSLWLPVSCREETNDGSMSAQSAVTETSLNLSFPHLTLSNFCLSVYLLLLMLFLFFITISIHLPLPFTLSQPLCRRCDSLHFSLHPPPAPSPCLPVGFGLAPDPCQPLSTLPWVTTEIGDAVFHVVKGTNGICTGSGERGLALQMEYKHIHN